MINDYGLFLILLCAIVTVRILYKKCKIAREKAIFKGEFLIAIQIMRKFNRNQFKIGFPVALSNTEFVDFIKNNRYIFIYDNDLFKTDDAGTIVFGLLEYPEIKT